MVKKTIKMLATTFMAVCISIAMIINSSYVVAILAAEPRVNWGLFYDEYVGYVDNGDNYARISCSVYEYTGALGGEATEMSNFKVAGIAKDTMDFEYTIKLVESDDVYSSTARYKKKTLNYGISYVEGTVYVDIPGPINGYQKRNIKADFRRGTRQFGEVWYDFVDKQMKEGN